jgi:hypothetical protein
MNAFGPRANPARSDRGDAQAVDRGLERGDSSQTLRAALAWSVGAPRRWDVQGLMDSTKASEFYPERPSTQTDVLP